MCHDISEYDKIFNKYKPNSFVNLIQNLNTDLSILLIVSKQIIFVLVHNLFRQNYLFKND